jgi:hypothetical protein
MAVEHTQLALCAWPEEKVNRGRPTAYRMRELYHSSTLSSLHLVAPGDHQWATSEPECIASAKMLRCRQGSG